MGTKNIREFPLGYSFKLVVYLILLLLCNSKMVVCQQGNENEKTLINQRIDSVENKVNVEIKLLRLEVAKLEKEKQYLESEKDEIRKENIEGISKILASAQNNSLKQILAIIISIIATAFFAYKINDSKIKEEKKLHHLSKIKRYLRSAENDEEFFRNPLYEDLSSHFKPLYQETEKYKKIWDIKNSLINKSIEEFLISFKKRAPFEIQIVKSNIYNLLGNPNLRIFTMLRYDAQNGTIGAAGVNYVGFSTGKPENFASLADKFIEKMQKWRDGKDAMKIKKCNADLSEISAVIKKIRDEADKYENLPGKCKFIANINNTKQKSGLYVYGISDERRKLVKKT